MRTFGVLVAGWLVGGAIIVALGGSSGIAATVERHQSRLSSARELRPQKPAGVAARMATFRETVNPVAALEGVVLRVPVEGVTPSDLQDTFTQPRGGGRIHRALDILAPRGTPVVAAVDGTVRKLFNSKAGGLSIYQFDREEQRVYYYAHLDRYADGLREGDAITQGTVIGYVGTTGNAPPGTPHLHFSVEVLPPTKEWWKGEPVNPYPLLLDAAR